MRSLMTGLRRGWASLAAGRRAVDERGATMVLTVLALAGMMGMAAIVLDIGNARRNRQGLVPGTDAAALAAAQFYVDTPGATNCTAIATTYLTANEPSATLTSCSAPVNVGPDRFAVTVSGQADSQTWFGSVIGSGGDISLDATSSALWGRPDQISGLRGIGFCIDSPNDWAAGPPTLADIIYSPTPGADVRIEIPGDNPLGHCGPFPFHWGLIDFDLGSTSFSDYGDWIRDGYQNPISMRDHSTSNCVFHPCTPGNAVPPPTDSGFWTIQAAMSDLRSSGEYAAFPVYNYSETVGIGPEFHLVGIVRARVFSFDVSTGHTPPQITLMVRPGVVGGTCCDGPAAWSGNRVVALCGVDDTGLSGC